MGNFLWQVIQITCYVNFELQSNLYFQKVFYVQEEFNAVYSYH